MQIGSVLGAWQAAVNFYLPTSEAEKESTKGALTTVGIRIHTKLKIIRPDIYKSNSL